MTDYQHIYRDRAAEYDRLVAAEDCDGNLLPAIAAVIRLAGARVVEAGVGTGRLTRLLASAGAASITGFDRSAEMLAIARRHLRAEATAVRWQLAVADIAELPVAGGAADLAIAGWVLGHATQWLPDRWPAAVDRAVAELVRAVAPGGAVILLETLGTGATRPAPPTRELADYYTRLEREHGFQRRTLPTDYGFATPEQAAEACRFFFGDDLAATILTSRWARVPEWTGLWCKRVS